MPPSVLRPPAFAQLLGASLLVSTLFIGSLALPASAQERGNREGEWRYIWGDAWSTRYSPLDQINADNFEDLEVAWFWKGDNFGPVPDNVGRSTPIYADGIVYTVAGRRRTVVAIDPATGETLWTFREPNTARWEGSPRQNYGRGVAYYEIDGRGGDLRRHSRFLPACARRQDGISAGGGRWDSPIAGRSTTSTAVGNLR